MENPTRSTIWLRPKGQLTLPADVREAARLHEGDPLEVEMTPEGILLRPKRVIDASQAWFWEDAWQAGEHEASAEITSGATVTYLTGNEFLASLDGGSEKNHKKTRSRRKRADL